MQHLKFIDTLKRHSMWKNVSKNKTLYPLVLTCCAYQGVRSSKLSMKFCVRTRVCPNGSRNLVKEMAETWRGNCHKYFTEVPSGISQNFIISKMKLFVTPVNGWKLFTMVPLNSEIYCQAAFSQFPWHAQNGRHSNLLLAHLEFSQNAFWQMQDYLIIIHRNTTHILSIPVISTFLSNGSCHDKSLPFFLCYPHSSEFWYSTLENTSAHIHPPYRVGVL